MHLITERNWLLVGSESEFPVTSILMDFATLLQNMHLTTEHYWLFIWCHFVLGASKLLDDNYMCDFTNHYHRNFMMASSSGNIFRVTDPCERNLPVTGGFPSQRPVTRSSDVFFIYTWTKRLSKQSRRWWFQTQSRSLRRHCNVLTAWGRIDLPDWWLSLRPSNRLMFPLIIYLQSSAKQT